MLYKKTSFIPILVLVMFLGVSAVAQADPPTPGGDSPEGSSLNETLNFNNLGTVMSGKNDHEGVDDIEDGVNDEYPGDEVDDPEENDDSVNDDLKQHPVASALAEFFDVSYDEVMALHEAGNGFGAITKAFFFADKFDPPLTPQELLEKAHGTGWGNILNQGNIQPGSVGNGGVNSNRPEHAGRPDQDNPEKDGPPGQVKKENEPDTVSTDSSGLVGPGGDNGNNGRNNGNSDNNGNNKGSNGRPDEQRGGNGNNGNNGNNGQGNSNGRGNK